VLVQAGAVLVLAGALAACQPSPAPPPATGPRLVVQGPSLQAGEGLVLHAEQAVVDDAGAGQAQVVRAELQPATPAGPGAAAPPPLQIEAPQSDWDLRSRTVHFTGGVTATRGEVQLRCDALEVRYAGPDRVDTATAEGHVLVTRGERRATSERAVLTAADGRIVLEGSPQLSDGPNTLTGRSIALFLDDERVQCEACRLVVAGSALSPQ